MRSYLTKMAVPVDLTKRQDREAALAEAGYNVFDLPSSDVFVDLLTDSGTGTMSEAQWAALLQGDEAYAGSRSFEHFSTAVADVMGFRNVVPTHQGRGAENLLYGTVVSDGDHVLNNTHFDTTRAHVVANGGEPIDCPVPDARDPDSETPFKGNLDVEAARDYVDEVGPESVPLVLLTITNNSAAGQPVSMDNIRETRAFADEIDAMFVIDACRFAENAYFITEREPEFSDASIAAVAKEQLSYADALVMSGKKDAIANIGGFVAVADGHDRLFTRLQQRGILYEGFSTYGGLAGRDLAAMAVGLREAVEREYVTHRVNQVAELGAALKGAALPIFEPIGGHAVYVDAGDLLDHIPSEQFPGQAFVCDLFLEGGIRGVELGSFAFPDVDRPEYARLAVPRRTYHREHIDHVASTAAAVVDHADRIRGLEIVTEPPMKELRHFSAELRPVD